MDNFLLQAIVTELESSLIGARLGRVYQIGATDLAMDFRLRDGRWLIVSTDPQRLALYLSAKNPKQSGEELRSDTAFVSLAKKYLGGARLLRVEKTGYDRVVNFEFEGQPMEGDSDLPLPKQTDVSSANPEKRTLVVLLTGRAANALIVEQSHVLAALRERSDENYTEPAPPAEKLDPFQLSATKLDELIGAYQGDIAAMSQQRLIGFSPLYANELSIRSKAAPPHEALQNLLVELVEAPPNPVIYSSPPIEELQREIGREEFNLILSPIALKHLEFVVPPSGGSGWSFTIPPEGGTTNAQADRYFSLLDQRRRFLTTKQKLQSHLTSRLKKQRTLIANLKRELAGFTQAEIHQRYGELLLANLHQATKTDRGFEVTDYYDEHQATIAIPTADKATAQEAAEHYFKLARKARHGQEAIHKRLPEIERETAEIENRLAQLATARRIEDLGIAAPQTAPPLRPQTQKSPQPGKKVKEEKLPGMRRYRSSDGYEILVGRTDRDNDHLTFRVAKSFDLWFHAADYPGSHVVLRNPQRKPLPPRAITEAAQLAAKFSHARTNAKVAVNYCEKKFVTKMKGFAPGQVRLSSFKTVLVEPAEAGEKI